MIFEFLKAIWNEAKEDILIDLIFKILEKVLPIFCTAGAYFWIKLKKNKKEKI